MPAGHPRIRSIDTPIFVGVICILQLLAQSSCRERANSSWPGSTLEEELAEFHDASQASEESDANDEVGGVASTQRTSTNANDFRFIAHNLSNWLTMEVSTSHGTTPRPKPEEEKKATITLFARHQPDILGVSEIGQKEDLDDLHQRLIAAGIDLPHQHHTGGADPTRHLALLSRFPIIAANRHESLRYQLNGQSLAISRGILDVTLDTPVGEIRFLGVHLKSKREVSWANQSKMRLAEAHLLRALIDDILTRDPSTKLIVYGDFNDTRNAPALRRVRGPGSGPTGLKMAALRDSTGLSWTYHWDRADVYSHIDFILLSEAIRSHVQWPSSIIIDDPETRQASDHRPLLLNLGSP